MGINILKIPKSNKPIHNFFVDFYNNYINIKIITNSKNIVKSNKRVYMSLLKLYNNYVDMRMINDCKKDVINRIKEAKKEDQNRSIYFLLDQNHGNLGDQAIGYAEVKFIRDNLKNYNTICVLEREYNLLKSYFKRIIKENDIIILIGGGSIGNQYIHHERSRRDVIKSFPNNKIISFPQTIYFSSDEYGKRELKNSVETYNSHKDLTVIAREKISYDIMKKVFNNNIIITPDIVLYLNKTRPNIRRQGALCCLRSDVESILTKEGKSNIISIVNKYFDVVTITDMSLNHNISIEDRELELEKKFNQFKSAELVITDRLHGMIFAAITATPCIVISNYNHKIRGTYNWIKHLDYISYCESIMDIPKYIYDLKEIKNCTYSNDFAIPFYKNIINAILTE